MEDLTIVFERNNQAVTSSRLIADYFGKRHDTVIRTIRKLGCSSEFNRHNFVEITYIDTRGRKQPFTKGKYIITYFSRFFKT